MLGITGVLSRPGEPRRRRAHRVQRLRAGAQPADLGGQRPHARRVPARSRRRDQRRVSFLLPGQLRGEDERCAAAGRLGDRPGTGLAGHHVRAAQPVGHIAGVAPDREPARRPLGQPVQPAAQPAVAAADGHHVHVVEPPDQGLGPAGHPAAALGSAGEHDEEPAAVQAQRPAQGGAFAGPGRAPPERRGHRQARRGGRGMWPAAGGTARRRPAPGPGRPPRCARPRAA
jgi:hypothetical protein